MKIFINAYLIIHFSLFAGCSISNEHYETNEMSDNNIENHNFVNTTLTQRNHRVSTFVKFLPTG